MIIHKLSLSYCAWSALGLAHFWIMKGFVSVVVVSLNVLATQTLTLTLLGIPVFVTKDLKKNSANASL